MLVTCTGGGGPGGLGVAHMAAVGLLGDRILFVCWEENAERVVEEKGDAGLEADDVVPVLTDGTSVAVCMVSRSGR